MHFLIATLLGVLCAFAVMRPREDNNRCGIVWAVLAGVLAANIPHVDSLLYVLEPKWHVAYTNGLSWSFFLAPFYAGGVAWLVSVLSRRPFMPLWLVSIFSVMTTLVLGLMTSRDIQALAPFSNARFSLDLLYPWNVTFFVLCLSVVAVAVFFKKWRHIVARTGFLVLAGYIGFVVSLTFKAQDFAERYASAFELEVEEVHLLPQPLSPFHWRLIIETKDQRFHDTLIHLFDDKEKHYKEGDNRTVRLKTLYKPVDKAVWRVYRRFGYIDPVFAKAAWVSMYKGSDEFQWLSEYWVAKDVVTVKGNRCVRFLDLRREGSRRTKEFFALICKENNEAVVYTTGADGSYMRLEMMY